MSAAGAGWSSAPPPPPARLTAIAERAAAALALHRLYDRNRDWQLRRLHHELLLALPPTPSTPRCAAGSGWPAYLTAGAGTSASPCGPGPPRSPDELVAAAARRRAGAGGVPGGVFDSEVRALLAVPTRGGRGRRRTAGPGSRAARHWSSRPVRPSTSLARPTGHSARRRSCSPPPTRDPAPGAPARGRAPARPARPARRRRPGDRVRRARAGPVRADTRPAPDPARPGGELGQQGGRRPASTCRGRCCTTGSPRSSGSWAARSPTPSAAPPCTWRCSRTTYGRNAASMLDGGCRAPTGTRLQEPPTGTRAAPRPTRSGSSRRCPRRPRAAATGHRRAPSWPSPCPSW